MAGDFEQRRNRILASLSRDDAALASGLLVPVALRFRQRLQGQNKRIDAVCFPLSGIVSVVAVSLRGRAQTEVGIIGRDGMTGVPLVHDADRSPYELVVQVEGQGLRMSAEDFSRLMALSPTAARPFRRFAHVFGLQCAHTALANTHGTIEQRLARWLLMMHDRVGHDEMLITHEFIAFMLGVRRAGVTIALQQLEASGSIETARGSVKIADRARLVEKACGLYGAPEMELERLFGSGNEALS